MAPLRIAASRAFLLPVRSTHARNPALYPETALNGVYLLLARPFAPLDGLTDPADRLGVGDRRDEDVDLASARQADRLCGLVLDAVGQEPWAAVGEGLPRFAGDVGLDAAA